MQNKKIDRAKQFMPFAALKGYYDLIKTCEKLKEDKKELSESESEILSNKISAVQKGNVISVKYYNIDSYEKITGIVSSIDFTNKVLTIIKTKINFEDIIEIFND